MRSLINQPQSPYHIFVLAIVLLIGIYTPVAAQEQVPMHALPVYTSNSEQLEVLLDRAIAFKQHHCDDYHGSLLFKVQVRTYQISGKTHLHIAASDFLVSTSNVFGVLQYGGHDVILEGEDAEGFFNETNHTADLSDYRLEESIAPAPGGYFTDWYYLYSENGFTLLERNAFCE